MFLKKFNFGKRKIYFDTRVFIIAEIGVNHEGNFNNCKKMILQASKSGADAVKLQTLDPDENYKNDTEYYKIFKKSFFNKNQIIELFKFSKKVGIEFFSTIGDFKTFQWFKKLNPPGYKISSGLLSHYPLIEKISNEKKPILLSTGLATLNEVDKVYNLLKLNKTKKISFLHCCSLYPSPDSVVNLSTIKLFKERYSIPIGYSDHSTNNHNIIYSVAAGATIVEKHFTLDKKRKNFDHKISCDSKELTEIVKKIRNLEIILGKFGKILSIKEKNKSKTMRRFIVAKKDLNSKTILSIDDLAFKRIKNTKSALEAKFTNKILGKKIQKKIFKNEIIIQKYFNN